MISVIWLFVRGGLCDYTSLVLHHEYHKSKFSYYLCMTSRHSSSPRGNHYFISTMATPSTASSKSTGVMEALMATVLFAGNELPSDDLVAHFRSLRRQSKGNKFQCLAKFLSESCTMLQQEVALLPAGLSQIIPPFQDIQGLVAHFANNRNGVLGPAVESALLCISQIGTLIGYSPSQNLVHILWL